MLADRLDGTDGVVNMAADLVAIDEMVRDVAMAQQRLQNWLATTDDLGAVTKAERQFSAAQDSLKKCRDGEAINLKMQNTAAAAKLRCQRRGGQILASMGPQVGRPKNGATVAPLRERLGVDSNDKAKHLSSRWQAIAKVPENEFESLVDVEGRTAAGQEITSNEAITVGKGKPPKVQHNSGEQEWYTPQQYIHAVRAVLGEIDLDPASSDQAQENVKASRHFTVECDGLSQQWEGRVFMNPPYTVGLVDRFMDKLCEHYDAGDVTEAITVTNNSTDTGWFQRAIRHASAFCLPSPRIRFLSRSGERGPPIQGQAFLYFGATPELFVRHFSQFGYSSVLGSGGGRDGPELRSSVAAVAEVYEAGQKLGSCRVLGTLTT